MSSSPTTGLHMVTTKYLLAGRTHFRSLCPNCILGKLESLIPCAWVYPQKIYSYLYSKSIVSAPSTSGVQVAVTSASNMTLLIFRRNLGALRHNASQWTACWQITRYVSGSWTRSLYVSRRTRTFFSWRTALKVDNSTIRCPNGRMTAPSVTGSTFVSTSTYSQHRSFTWVMVPPESHWTMGTMGWTGPQSRLSVVLAARACNLMGL